MEAYAIVEPDVFSEARASYDRLESRLASPESRTMSHSELENLVEREGREVMRTLLHAHFELRGWDKPVGVVQGADNVKRTHQREGTRKLETIFGPVSVTRTGFGQRGVESLFPLDGALNLPEELYSFGVRRRAAEGAIHCSFDEVVRTVGKTTGAEVAKRQVEELVRRAAVDFDAFYAKRREGERAEAEPILVLTFDGKGVPMRKEDLREATRKAAQRRQKQRRKLRRRRKGEKAFSKRMATVAAVYTIAPFVRTPLDVVNDLASRKSLSIKRPRPVGKCVWASVEKEPEEVIDDAFREALARDPSREKQWYVLVDGNPTQIELAEQAAARFGVSVTIVLDLIHVTEYLWRAAYVFEKEGSPEAEAWVSERLLRLLEGHASDVAAGIRRSATKRKLRAKRRAPADKCADYLLNHVRFLAYDQRLAEGAPIATGVIEGTVRHLVRDRMELTGARWSLAGAEAVLRLRSLHANGDLDDYWCFHEHRERERNHACHYRGNRLPRMAPPPATKAARPQLRLVTK